MVHQLTMIDEEGLGLKYTIHNPMTEWNLMKPMEREIYESIQQLKFALTNYAVANGYPLQFTKSNSQTLQVKCGQSQEGQTCPFSLWATQIENEKSFQIKKLIGKHICIKTNDLGPIVTSDWIAKHYMNELSENPDMKLKDLKADIKKKFSCNVDISKCHRAKKRAQELVNMSCTEALPLNERIMRVKRKMNVSEKDDMYLTSRAVTCKNCLEKGHNIRTCKNAKRILPPKEKKKVGRPRIVKDEKLKKRVKGKNKKLRVDELPTEVPMSMKMIVDEDDEGVDEIQTTIDDLKKSGYTEDEIDAIPANEAQEDDDQSGIKDTLLHADAPIEVHDDDDDDDDDDGVEDDDEWIEETQPLVVIKGRRPSERIIKIKLRKKIDGRGSALGTPIDIE